MTSKGNPDREPREERPLLVASMIVRDEAALLGQCLASIAPLVDEILVCDTGSTDGTVAIAELAGATIVRHAWSDDFSEARNHALDAARHGRYVLWIDADEQLECDDPAAVRASLEDGTAQTLAIEIVSTRRDAPTSIGLGTRIFRPDGLHFEGALHERLVTQDGSEPSVEAFSHVQIAHSGYDAGVVDQYEKAARNVRIARTQYKIDRCAKTALDLARSLAQVDQSPKEILAIVAAGLADLDRSHDAYLPLLTMQADLLLKVGDLEGAFATACEILESDPGNDVAAAVLARTATDLERFDELISHSTSFDPLNGGRPSTVPANRALAWALTAGAYARLGRVRESRLAATRSIESLPPRSQAFEILVGALSGVDQQTSAQLLTWVGGEDTGALLSEMIGRSNDSTYDQEAPDTGALGITLDFDLDDSLDPCQATADSLPPNRRVLDLSGLPEMSSVLEIRGHRVALFDADTDELATVSDRFDVVIVNPLRTSDEAFMTSVMHLIDPSGMLVTWVDEADTRSQIEVRLGTAGLMPTPTQVADVVMMRPVWTRETLASLTTDRPAAARLFVMSGDVAMTQDQSVALRASLPSDIEIIEVDGIDTDEDAEPEDLVLILATGLVPEPHWIQAIWDSARMSASPVGCRVVDPTGSTVHAGARHGDAIGGGEPPATPLLASDRFDVELIAPYVSRARDLTSPTRGRLLGHVAAFTLESSQDHAGGTGLRDLYPHTVVFLGGRAPGHNHPEIGEALEKTFERLMSSGITPVYQWRDRADASPGVISRWRNRGVVVLAPPPAIHGGQLLPDAARPQPGALVQAFAPACVVFLSSDSLGSDFRAASGAAARATIAYAGQQSAGDLEERFDISCAPNDLPDQIIEIVDMISHSPAPAIAAIDHRDAAAGLTSVIIPVFNRWDLTKACLDSLSRHTRRPIEIIIVDNGSSDETAATLADRTDIQVISNQNNLGFPAAVNQGIVASTGEFVCVLNNDTAVTSGWLESLHAAIAIDGTGVVGPRTNQIGGLQIVPDALPPTEGKKANRWAQEWTRVRKRRTWTTNRLVGFCLLARRSTFELVGGFDESFGIGNYEDDEFGRRVQQAGFSLRVVDDSFVLHHGSATFISMNIDHTAASHRAARNLAQRDLPSCASTTALILSNGDAAAASVSAATALRVADRVRIAERSAVASTELATAALGNGLIEVLATDWNTDEGSAAAMHGLAERLVIVIEAGERVVADDWGAARSELDAIAPGPIEVGVSDHAEVRIVPPGPSAVRMVGARSPHAVKHFSLRRVISS